MPDKMLEEPSIGDEAGAINSSSAPGQVKEIHAAGVSSRITRYIRVYNCMSENWQISWTRGIFVLHNTYSYEASYFFRFRLALCISLHRDF